ncbi:MAG: dTDP-4-dehydrorhamnose reductase [Akkermansiaceae bacterium]
MKKKILLTGANGQLGTFVQRLSADFPSLDLIPLTRTELDLSQPDTIAAVIRAHQPDVVLNAAAFTAVDAAEEERELAMMINGKAVGEIAKVCEELGASLIQVSTDYVFNGEKEGEYLPTDPTDPVNYYGETKLMGEQLALKHCSRAIIVRTSWLISDHGKNFQTTMHRLFTEREELAVIADQTGRPTQAADLARHCCQLATQTPQTSSITHYAGATVMTWHALAESLLASFENPVTKVVLPIVTSEYPTPAKRPKNSVLIL